MPTENPLTKLIIPYQELSGSYNFADAQIARYVIIPYQELSGSYNS